MLLRQAAELGEARAMNELAEALVESRGVDDPEALRWFHKAADGRNAAAMVHLGVISLLGTGGADKDPLEAAKWFGKAADAGSAAGMYDLATMYDDGQGIPEDPVSKTIFTAGLQLSAIRKRSNVWLNSRSKLSK